MLCQLQKVAIDRGEQPLLTSLDWQVAAGECWQILGENGLGKTSLLRVLAGLAPVTAGDLQIAEHLYLGHKQALQPSLRVTEWCRFHPYLQTHQADIAAALNTMHLSHLQDRPIAVLSQGQRQRLHLLPLACESKPLWLLDEPFSGLDRESVSLIESLCLKQLESGGAVILTSHQAVENIPNIRQMPLDQYSVVQEAIC